MAELVDATDLKENKNNEPFRGNLKSECFQNQGNLKKS